MKQAIWTTKTFWGGLSTMILGLLSLFDVGGKYVQAATIILTTLTLFFVRDAISDNTAVTEKTLDAVEKAQ